MVRGRSVSISAGFTAEEIRSVVHEYTVQPFGRKAEWLSAQGVSYDRLRRWRLAVVGDRRQLLGDGVQEPVELGVHRVGVDLVVDGCAAWS
jgi:hypothetical protein